MPLSLRSSHCRLGSCRDPNLGSPVRGAAVAGSRGHGSPPGAPLQGRPARPHRICVLTVPVTNTTPPPPPSHPTPSLGNRPLGRPLLSSLCRRISGLIVAQGLLQPAQAMVGGGPPAGVEGVARRAARGCAPCMRRLPQLGVRGHRPRSRAPQSPPPRPPRLAKILKRLASWVGLAMASASLQNSSTSGQCAACGPARHESQLVGLGACRVRGAWAGGTPRACAQQWAPFQAQQAARRLEEADFCPRQALERPSQARPGQQPTLR